jgi:hypothetical protein
VLEPEHDEAFCFECPLLQGRMTNVPQFASTVRGELRIYSVASHMLPLSSATASVQFEILQCTFPFARGLSG